MERERERGLYLVALYNIILYSRPIQHYRDLETFGSNFIQVKKILFTNAFFYLFHYKTKKAVAYNT